MQLKSLLGISLLLISSITYAQTLETWNWDIYKMKFKAPGNMVIQANDANSYQATNNKITLEIYPRKGENKR